MNSRILTLAILSLLIPGCLMLLTGNVKAADISESIVTVELEAEMDFPPDESIGDGYWWRGRHDEVIFHSNNQVYHLDEAEGYITVPTVHLAYGGIIQNTDGPNITTFDLGLERDNGWSMDGFVIEESSNGDIISFVYWDGDSTSSYVGAFLWFEVDPTGVPDLARIFSVDFQVSTRPYDFELHEMGDELAVTFKDSFSGAFILSSSGDINIKELGVWNTWSATSFNDDLILYWLDTDGSFKLTRLSNDLTIIDERIIDGLEPGEGADLKMEMVDLGDHFNLITFFDETYETVYDKVEITRIDRDLDIVARNEIEFPEDMIITGKYPLVHYGRNVGFISGNLYRVYFFNADSYALTHERLLHTYDMDNDFYLENFLISDIQDLDVFVDEVRGLPVVMIKNSYYSGNFGTMLTRNDVIPEFGSLVIEGDYDIISGEYIVNRDMTIKGNMTIKGSKISFTEYIDINVQGSLILEDSTMTWDERNEDGNIHVSGTVEIRRSYIETGLYLTDSEAIAEIYGNPFPMEEYEGYLVNLVHGHVKIHEMTIEDHESQGHSNDYLFLLPSSSSKPVLEFFNCTFLESQPFIYSNNGDVRFFNTRMDGIDGSSSFKFYFGTMEGCVVSNSTGLTGHENFLVKDCTFKDEVKFNIWSDGSFTDSTFIDLISPFEEMENCDVTFSDCLFRNCPDAIVADYCDMEIRDCQFYDTPIPINLVNMRSFNITGCEFNDFHKAIIIDEEVLDDDQPGEYIITGNTFGKGNSTVFIEDLYFRYRSLKNGDVSQNHYGSNNKVYEKFTLRFIDARNNKFIDRDIDEVAASLSPMIYFLPYLDNDGNVISTNDNDMDGMKDDWERDNGFDPTMIVDRYMDADLDRYTNYEEYMEGTDPHDKNSNPGQIVRIRILIFQIVLIFIPIMILVCYLYYFQIAFAGGKRRKFMKKYWRYKAQRDIDRKATEEHEERMHPSSGNLPVFKREADELPAAPPEPPKLPKAVMKKRNGGDEE